MPTTARGIEYPDSNGSTELWLHYQAQAETTDAAIGVAADETLEAAQTYTDEHVDSAVAFSDRYLSVDQSLADNVSEAIDFNAADSADVGITFGSSTDRWTCHLDGLYLLNGAVSFESDSVGARVVQVQHLRGAVMTVVLEHQIYPDSGMITVPFSKTLRLEEDDRVSVWARQNSGGALDVRGISGASRYTHADIARIGA